MDIRTEQMRDLKNVKLHILEEDLCRCSNRGSISEIVKQDDSSYQLTLIRRQDGFELSIRENKQIL